MTAPEAAGAPCGCKRTSPPAPCHHARRSRPLHWRCRLAPLAGSNSTHKSNPVSFRSGNWIFAKASVWARSGPRLESVSWAPFSAFRFEEVQSSWEGHWFTRPQSCHCSGVRSTGWQSGHDTWPSTLPTFTAS
jgi:hypothetical protein